MLCSYRPVVNKLLWWDSIILCSLPFKKQNNPPPCLINVKRIRRYTRQECEPDLSRRLHLLFYNKCCRTFVALASCKTINQISIKFAGNLIKIFHCQDILKLCLQCIQEALLCSEELIHTNHPHKKIIRLEYQFAHLHSKMLCRHLLVILDSKV